MSILKPFKGLRPPKSIVADVAARPYDVLNSSEARVEAKDNSYSLLHITKPEIDFPESIDEHDETVYNKAVENFSLFKNKEWLVQDKQDCLYIYGQTMNGKTQYGLVGCCAVEDYMNDIIKKHELTRKDKEEDRMKHVRNTNANIEPVFFSYPAVQEVDNIVNNIIKNEPEYDFTANDGVGHHFWVVNNNQIIDKLISLFEGIKYLYVADGHHRTAAAALVGNEKKKTTLATQGMKSIIFSLLLFFLIIN